MRGTKSSIQNKILLHANKVFGANDTELSLCLLDNQLSPVRTKLSFRGTFKFIEQHNVFYQFTPVATVRQEAKRFPFYSSYVKIGKP